MRKDGLEYITLINMKGAYKLPIVNTYHNKIWKRYKEKDILVIHDLSRAEMTQHIEEKTNSIGKGYAIRSNIRKYSTFTDRIVEIHVVIKNSFSR